MKPVKIILIAVSVLWGILGALILLWTLFWYYKSITIGNLGVIATAALMAAGVYVLMFYAPITILLAIVYFISRRFILRKRLKVEQDQNKKQRSK